MTSVVACQILSDSRQCNVAGPRSTYIAELMRRRGEYKETLQKYFASHSFLQLETRVNIYARLPPITVPIRQLLRMRASSFAQSLSRLQRAGNRLRPTEEQAKTLVFSLYILLSYYESHLYVYLLGFHYPALQKGETGL